MREYPPQLPIEKRAEFDRLMFRDGEVFVDQAGNIIEAAAVSRFCVDDEELSVKSAPCSECSVRSPFPHKPDCEQGRREKLRRDALRPLIMNDGTDELLELARQIGGRAAL